MECRGVPLDPWPRGHTRRESTGIHRHKRRDDDGIGVGRRQVRLAGKGDY